MTTASRQARIFSSPRDRVLERRLELELGVPSIVAAVLVRRGFADPADAEKFLNPRLEDLGDPRLLPDYAKAQALILAAKESKELIYVHGDYDVDGVTSAALLAKFLGHLECSVHTHVPHRMKEGYGIHLAAVEEARQMGAKLFLTCDCGISAHEQIAAARDAGMRVLVTDHHLVGETLPPADAVVNPHRKDSLYPFKELSGAGVAYRLCEGIARELGLSLPYYHKRFLDLAVLGTVADVMPLLGDNRIIAKFGLEYLVTTDKKGLKALKEVAELTDATKLKSGHIGFQLGPRLNATGRIDDAKRALELLMSKDEAEAGTIARKIDEINKDRRARQEQMVAEAVEYVESLGVEKMHAIVVGHESWHPGIIGLVAGKLVEKFGRPAFVMSINPEEGTVKGSARSIPGFHLGHVMDAHTHLLSGGGHAAAAGFGAELSKFDDICLALNEYAATKLTAEDFEPLIEVDAEVETSELTLRNFEAIERLEPFGNANPTPTLCARNCTVFEMSPTKKESIKVRVAPDSGPTVTGFWGAYPEPPEWFEKRMRADVIFQGEINEWEGKRSPQWRIKHIEKIG